MCKRTLIVGYSIEIRVAGETTLTVRGRRRHRVHIVLSCLIRMYVHAMSAMCMSNVHSCLCVYMCMRACMCRCAHVYLCVCVSVDLAIPSACPHHARFTQLCLHSVRMCLSAAHSDNTRSPQHLESACFCTMRTSIAHVARTRPVFVQRPKT